MSSRRSVLLFLSLATLVGLLALVPLPADAGVCGSFPRAAASWDQPSPQAVDGLISPPVPHADPAAHVRNQVGPARRVEARLVLPAERGRVGSPGLDTGATRSPPLV